MPEIGFIGLLAYFCDFREEIESRDSEVRSDTRDHLLFGITGKYTEYDRSLIGKCEIHDTSSRLTTDIVEVWRIPTDDHSEGDDEVILL